MLPTFFPLQSDFRKWLLKNHKKETSLLVGFYKVGSGKPSMSWSESVDEALCAGWIDGVRKSIDKESYSIRFTPRRKGSIWSKININKMAELTKAGLMRPEGLSVFEKRDVKKTNVYSYEKEALEFSDTFEKKFKTNRKAWKFFITQAPSYRKVAVHLVMSAKQIETKTSRLKKLISASAESKRL